MTITRQGSGSYTGRAWTRTAGGERKRLRATAATKESVEEQLRAQARGYLFTEGILGEDSSMAAALAAWIDDRDGNVRPQTLRIYRDTVRWLSEAPQVSCRSYAGCGSRLSRVVGLLELGGCGVAEARVKPTSEAPRVSWRLG